MHLKAVLASLGSTHCHSCIVQPCNQHCPVVRLAVSDYEFCPNELHVQATTCLSSTFNTSNLNTERFCRRPSGAATYLWVVGTHKHASQTSFYEFPLEHIRFAAQQKDKYDLLLVTSIRCKQIDGQDGPSLTRFVNMYELSRRHFLTSFLGLTAADAAVSFKTCFLLAAACCNAMLAVVAKPLAATTSRAQARRRPIYCILCLHT